MRSARILYGFVLVSICIGLLLCTSRLSHSQQKIPSKSDYVGSEICKECHADEYESFVKNSKKSRSYSSVEKMRKGLTAAELTGCYGCHTTGYGQPGGFRSVAETPHLKNAGCESCHGPGSTHCETQSADDIKGKITASDCQTCHSSDRVAAFRFKPLVFGGAH